MPGNIGERIKKLRIEKGLTLASLGKMVNLSASHLSQIEKNHASPSLTTLMDIAKTLDTDLRFFFEADPDTAYITRVVRGKPLAESELPEKITSLVPTDVKKSLEVSHIVIQPHFRSAEMEQFAGEDFCFTLSGKLTIRTREGWFELEAGDSIHFDANQSYSWENQGDEPCVFIWGRAASMEPR